MYFSIPENGWSTSSQKVDAANVHESGHGTCNLGYVKAWASALLGLDDSFETTDNCELQIPLRQEQITKPRKQADIEYRNAKRQIIRARLYSESHRQSIEKRQFDRTREGFKGHEIADFFRKIVHDDLFNDPSVDRKDTDGDPCISNQHSDKNRKHQITNRLNEVGQDKVHFVHHHAHLKAAGIDQSHQHAAKKHDDRRGQREKYHQQDFPGKPFAAAHAADDILTYSLEIEFAANQNDDDDRQNVMEKSTDVREVVPDIGKAREAENFHVAQPIHDAFDSE